MLYNIPADRGQLIENEDEHYQQGANDFGERGWGGPLPPEGHGQHRYYFKLYALDEDLDLEPGLAKDDLLQRIDGRILAEAETVGWYERAAAEE